MTLPIILLSVLALALGTLSVVLSLLVGRRYHQINRENSRTLNEFRDDNNRLAQQVRREGDRVIHLQSDLAIHRSQIAQLNTSTGGFWRTGIGTIVQIRQMSDNHLEQALAHLKETGREGSQSWRDMLNEQRRRRHDVKMSSATTPIQEFNKLLLGNPAVSVEEKGTDVAQTLTMDRLLVGGKRAMIDFVKANSDQIRTILGERHAHPVPDWTEIDRIIGDLIGRTVMSRAINTDLLKLQHLLARGRKS